MVVGGVVGVEQTARTQTQAPEQAVLTRYCIACHNEKTKSAGLMLDKLDFAHPGASAETWEKVVRKVRAGMMPPITMGRRIRTRGSSVCIG